MKPVRGLGFLSLLLFVPTLALAVIDPGFWMHASRLQAAIQREGPNKVAAELFRQQDSWSYVMTKIGSGDRWWFSAGSHLRPGLHGAALKDWSKAMSLAMEHLPKHVLRSADAKTLRLICSPDVNYTASGSPEVVGHHVNRLMRIVRGVHETSLQKKKMLCLQQLSDDRAELNYMIRQDL